MSKTIGASFSCEFDDTGAGVFHAASKVAAHRSAIGAGLWCSRAGYAPTVEHGPGCRVKVFVPGCVSGWVYIWPESEGTGTLTQAEFDAAVVGGA